MGMDKKKPLAMIVKSPAGILFEQTGLRSIQLELSDGKIGIRGGHASMIGEMIDGDAILDDGESVARLQLRGGIVYIENDVVTIYTHSLDSAEAAFESTSDQFNDIYDAIISSLIPGLSAAEGQNDT